MSSLLRQKRFGPFFWTQFLGAFNDNVYKNALLILLAYTAKSEAESGFLVSLAGGIFILPFLLFSPIAGQLSDKFEKSKFIIATKVSEIIAMILGVVGFYFENKNLLIAVLFLMGAQSTFFGPTKYSILPQVLKEEKELMAGTAIVEMGTFLAILLGTILGGLLISFNKISLCISILIFSIIGYLASRKIPPVEIGNPDLKIKLNPLKQMSLSLNVALQNRSVIFGILAISWFWFLGAVYLSQIAVFVKYLINADKIFVSIFLSVFTLSLAIGAIVCNSLSKKVIELGLVPLGSLGMSLFGLDLLFVNYSIFDEPLVSFFQVFQIKYFSTFIRLIIDFFSVGFFGSFYIVPVYAILQKRSSQKNRSQVIASNNIVNAVFMIISAMFTMVAYKFNYTTEKIFAMTSVLNFVLIFVFSLFLPELLYRFKLWLKNRLGTMPLFVGESILKNADIVLIPDRTNLYSFVETICYLKSKPLKFLFFQKRSLSLIDKLYVSGTCLNLSDIKKITQTIKVYFEKNEFVCMTQMEFDLIKSRYPQFIDFIRSEGCAISNAKIDCSNQSKRSLKTFSFSSVPIN